HAGPLEHRDLRVEPVLAGEVEEHADRDAAGEALAGGEQDAAHPLLVLELAGAERDEVDAERALLDAHEALPVLADPLALVGELAELGVALGARLDVGLGLVEQPDRALGE